MTLTMADKKTPKTDAKPSNKSQEPIVGFRPSKAFRAALEGYCKNHPLRPDMSQVIEAAVREYLIKENVVLTD